MIFASVMGDDRRRLLKDTEGNVLSSGCSLFCTRVESGVEVPRLTKLIMTFVFGGMRMKGVLRRFSKEVSSLPYCSFQIQYLDRS